MTEWWQWIAWVTGPAALVLAVVTFFTTRSDAKRARRDATSAESAALRSAAALEEANRIRLAENPPENAPWSSATPTTNEGVRVTNESSRTAVVVALSADPPGTVNAIVRPPALPLTVEPKDHFELIFRSRARRTARLAIRWRWSDETEEREAIRTVG